MIYLLFIHFMCLLNFSDAGFRMFTLQDMLEVISRVKCNLLI